MTILWSFSCNSFVKSHGYKKFGATKWPCYIRICVVTRCVIKRLHCTHRFFMQTAKTMNRPGRCQGWSESFLSAHVMLLVLSCSRQITSTVKPVIRGHSKRRPKIGFQDWISLTAGQKYCRVLYCRMLHESILQCFRPSLSYHLSFKTFVLSIFKWPLKRFYCRSLRERSVKSACLQIEGLQVSLAGVTV